MHQYAKQMAEQQLTSYIGPTGHDSILIAIFKGNFKPSWSTTTTIFLSHRSPPPIGTLLLSINRQWPADINHRGWQFFLASSDYSKGGKGKGKGKGKENGWHIGKSPLPNDASNATGGRILHVQKILFESILAADQSHQSLHHWPICRQPASPAA
ncbi:hypothetical protein LY78DRAFT_170058 [Colletotrichum sublineola]|nr:hypothetical protein LY78DRAFT_170058 [Colletotrichum sublineola]